MHQNTFVSPGSVYLGSRAEADRGSQLDLTSLAQAYGIRGSSIYTKGLLSAHVTNSMDVTGQFLYTQHQHHRELPAGQLRQLRLHQSGAAVQQRADI